MVVGEALGHRDDVEDANADRLLLRRCHQLVAVLLHPLERAAEGAGRGDVSARKRDGGIGAVHLHHVDLGGVDAQMIERAQELVVGHVADRGRDLLALQFARIRLRDAGVGVDDAVVGLRVAHRHADELERETVGDRDNPRHQPLGIGDLHVARDHRLAHLVAVAEGAPLHLDAHCLVIGLLELRYLVRGRPLEEVSHRDLVEGGCRRCEQHRHTRRDDCHEAGAFHVEHSFRFAVVEGAVSAMGS